MTDDDRRRRATVARDLDDLVYALDRLTANLNEIKTARDCRIVGAVRWMLPKVIDERNRASDAARRLRA